MLQQEIDNVVANSQGTARDESNLRSGQLRKDMSIVKAYFVFEIVDHTLNMHYKSGWVG